MSNQSNILSPFVNIEGAWFLVTNWRPDIPVGTELCLRRLGTDEVKMFRDLLEDALVEIWATMFPTDKSIKDGG